ncbi:MAG: diacylglycerol kinase family protein [Chloroflexaceae bacterium]|nr:diacylglycerol kinase family protein [Chloroflexaceae bacterium]
MRKMMRSIADAGVDRQCVEWLNSFAGPRSTPQNWLVVINPSAGHHTNGWLRKIGRRMQRELGSKVAITRSYDEIAELLQGAVDAEGIAVFGGDGTVAEAVNHMRLDRQHLLVLPGGTGNGLARDLGIASVDHALAAYRANRRQSIDLLQVTFATPYERICRLMVSTLSLGYAAETVVLAGRLPRALNAFRYVGASILQTARMPNLTLAVEIDGTPPLEVRLTNLMINNTRHAGNFCAFRRASLLDGQCDLLLAKNSLWQQILNNLAVLSHTHLYRSGREFRARRIRIRSARPFRLMLDGEIWEDVRELHVHILPQRLCCYCRFAG